uniref:SP-RING-type domain-containing protein n=1 Tax=Hemiselmis tepida TaxID=464990 RepID=A0A7S0W037_9CRYP
MSIRMRAFKTPFSNAAVAESDLVDCGWISCVVVVNGNRVVERNIQEPKALVIDKYCKAGLNTVCVHSSGERFVVSVQMGSATPIEEVEKMVQANTLDESQQLLKRIIAPGDDDIACDEIEVSLRCPFGFVRIKTPARGRDCDHIQCFDLQTWLQYCSTYGSSKCFNCNKIIPIGLLRTCPLMADVLRQVSGEADKVTITKDGNFRGLTLRKADPPAADASQGQSDGGGPSRNDKQVQDKDMAEEDSADDAHLSEFAKKLRMSGVWEYNREVNEAYERGFSKQHEQQQREEQSKSAKASPAKDEEEVAEDLDDFIDDDEDEEASSMDKDDDEDAGNETDGSQISTEKKKKVALVRHSRRASAGKKISYAESDDSEEAMDEDSDEAGPSSGRPKAPTSAGAGASSSASGKRKRVTRAASSDDGGSTTDGGNDSDMSSASERKKAAQKGAKGKRKARAASIGEDEGDSWEPGADSD